MVGQARRGFLVAAGAATVAGLTGKGAQAKAVPSDRRRRLLGATAKGGADNVIVPPFEVRVLAKLGFGHRRTQLHSGSGPSQPADTIFTNSFETPTGNQAAFGQDDVAYFLSLGNTDDERLENYLNIQLDPALNDSDVDSRMAQYPGSFSTLDQPLGPVFNSRECKDFTTYNRPRYETESAAFLRACYSRRQLFELITDFWHNHFNVFVQINRDAQVAWAAWDRDVVRANTFGNFYQMLIRSARHVCMLRYLDNYTNEAGGFNENYARELFELHTLGAENYFGTQASIDLPALAQNPYNVADPELDAINFPIGVAAGYVDEDVYAAARALTGWRYHDVNDDNGGCGTGAFMTEEDEHDKGAKAILSRGFNVIPPDGAALDDGRLVIKLAAYHPGTATHIARKLCRRLIADEPPESIVQAAAQTFFTYRRAPDQIARTLRTIILSDEFKDASNWGSKIRRPYEYVVSAMRSAGCNHTWRSDDNDTNDMLNRFDDAGQELFSWRTPDGYPDRRNHWEGSTTLVHSWRTIDWLLDRNDDEPDAIMPITQISLDNLQGNPTPRQLVEFWCHWIIGFTPPSSWVGAAGSGGYASAPTVLGRTCLQFMTQLGFGSGNRDASVWSEDEPIDRSDLQDHGYNGGYYWGRRLRGMVALILWSPQFMQR